MSCDHTAIDVIDLVVRDFVFTVNQQILMQDAKFDWWGHLDEDFEIPQEDRLLERFCLVCA